MQERYERLFEIRDHTYSISIQTKGSNSFGIDIVDQDSMNRWSADFTASLIKDLTRKVGSEKRISIFWRMLQTAIEGTSNEVSLDVFTSQDVRNMQRRSRPDQTTTARDDKRYIIITQTTEFEQIKYPLPLELNPLSGPEFATIIKQLRKENAALRKQGGVEKIQDLENQLYDLEQAYHELSEQKEAEIEELKSQLRKLQQQNTQLLTSRHPREPYSQKENSPRNSANIRKARRSASVKPSSQSYRAPSVGSNSSRLSQNSQRSRGSVRSTNSRSNSPGRSPRTPYYKSPQRTPRMIEEETDYRRRKCKQFIAERYQH